VWQFVSQLLVGRGHRESAEGPAQDHVAAETRVGRTRMHELMSVDGLEDRKIISMWKSVAASRNQSLCRFNTMWFNSMKR